MDTGINREQIDAAKRVLRRWTEDPVSLRCVVSVLIFAAGYLGAVRPLTMRLEAARDAHVRRSRRLAKVEDLAHWKSQTDRFAERTAHLDDVVEWQRYVLEKLGRTDVRLLNLEPRATGGKGVYKFVEMEVVARSESYSDLATFIHHLERGERIVRVERVRIELAQGSLTLTATIKGLCRPNLAPPRPAPGPADDEMTGPDGSAGDEGAVDDLPDAQDESAPPDDPSGGSLDGGADDAEGGA